MNGPEPAREADGTNGPDPDRELAGTNGPELAREAASTIGLEPARVLRTPGADRALTGEPGTGRRW